MSQLPRKQPNILFYVIILLYAICFVQISSFPHKSTNVDESQNGNSKSNGAEDDMEIITVEEIVRDSNVNIVKNLTSALITPNNAAKKKTSSKTSTSNEPMIDIADDLIFLAERPQQQQYANQVMMKSGEVVGLERQQNRQPQQQLTSTVGTFQQIDLLTSAEEDSLTAAISTSMTVVATTKSTSVRSDEERINDYNAKADNDDDDDGIATIVSIKHVVANNKNGIVVEDDDDEEETVNSNIDVSHNDDNDDDDDGSDVVEISSIAVVGPPPTIDMSDFVALIPIGAVKSIAANYYRNDPEVQRAYAYLNSEDFLVVRQHIIVLPEVQAFLRYLNNSGLDVVGFLYTLTNLTRKPDELNATIEENTPSSMTDDTDVDNDVGSGSDSVLVNEIENGIQLNQMVTTTASTKANTEETLKGLHGLVDSVLEILPQDQILATFFDKLESNEQFTRLVDRIGQPAFARILHNLQNSAQLRTLVYILHNHGIFITRIVDSLKAYFFLGTF